MRTTLHSFRAELDLQLAILRERGKKRDLIEVSKAGDTFLFPDGSRAPGLFIAVIADFRLINRYYKDAYITNQRHVPDCWAVGNSVDTLTPSSVISRQSETCSACPLNRFGSRGRGKACRNEARLAIVPPGANAEMTPWILKVTPTSIRAFEIYEKLNAATYQLPLFFSLTEIALNTAKQYPRLTFENAGSNENFYAHLLAGQSARAALEAVG